MKKTLNEIKRKGDMGIGKMLITVTWITVAMLILWFLGLKGYAVYLDSATKACLSSVYCTSEEITDLGICTPSPLNKITYNATSRKYKLTCWDEVGDNNKNLLGW